MSEQTPSPDCELVTPLKGDRDYVHSTDILSALQAEAWRRLGSGSWVRQLTIRQRATKQVVAAFQPRGDAFGSFRLQGTVGILQGSLVESSRPIVQRVSFEEDQLLSRVLYRGEEAILPSAVGGFTRFEQVVLLMKALADRQVPGPWVLAQIDLDRPVPERGQLEIRYTRTIQDRLKFGVLTQDGLGLGTVRSILDQTYSAERTDR